MQTPLPAMPLLYELFGFRLRDKKTSADGSLVPGLVCEAKNCAGRPNFPLAACLPLGRITGVDAEKHLYFDGTKNILQSDFVRSVCNGPCVGDREKPPQSKTVTSSDCIRRENTFRE